MLAPVGLCGRGIGRHTSGEALPELFYDFTNTTLEACARNGPVPTWTDRGSDAMMWNSAGLLQYAPHQLLENTKLSAQSGSPLVPSGWSSAGGGTLSYEDQGGYFETTQTTVAARPHLVNAVFNLVAETPYTLFWYISDLSDLAGRIGRTLNHGGANEASFDTSDYTGPGWYASGFITGAGFTSCTIRLGIGIDSNDTGSISFSRPGIIKGFEPGVAVGTAVKLSGEPLGRWIGTDDGDEPKYEPRLAAHYNDGSWINGGYLVEGARTNSLLQSRGYDTTWSASVSLPNLTQDQTGSDGVANQAWTIEDDDATGFEGILQDVTIANDGNTHCASWRVKKDSDQTRFPEFRLDLRDGTAQRIFIQLNTQTGATAVSVSTGTTNSGVIDEGDWWRLWVTVANNTSGNVTARVTLLPAFENVIGDLGDGTVTGSIVMDHSQLELNASFPSSTIPTTTAAVTQNEDVLSLTDLTWFNESEGTLFLEAAVPHLFDSDITIFQVQNAGAHYYFLGYESVGTDVRVVIQETALEYNAQGTSLAANTQFKVALRYATNAARAFVNGAAISAEDTSVTLPTTMTAVNFGRFLTGGSVANSCFITGVQGYNVSKSDSELASLTS